MTEVMQFRDYVFRSNPQSITVNQGMGLAEHFCPGQGNAVQDLGDRGRTVRCGGSFWGNSYQEAVGQLENFRRQSQGDEPGMLYLPGLEPFPARLKELVFEAVGDGRIIPYYMTFVEARVVL